MFSISNQLFRFFILIALLTLPENAFAYLDPGTGSYLFQVLIASFLGALYAVKVYWQKIVSFFRKKDRKVVTEPSAETVPEQAVQNEATMPEPQETTREEE